MNRKTFEKYGRRLALGLVALAISAAPSFAQTTIDLCATTGSVTMPDTTVIPIWGYVLGSTCTAGDATLPNPVLEATEGETLTINLTNNLTVPVSIFVPGYRATTTGGTPGMFTAEAAPSGGTATYDFAAKAGTYLYHSGTDITTQVPMGLYGALVVNVAPGQAYSDVSFDQDEVLVYSEIDPNLNADPTNFGGARVINWSPQYFLINGVAHPDTPDITIDVSTDVLLRFVNAGLRTFVPTLDGGLYMSLVAEDGNRYPQPLSQYGIELQAGKTIDAAINAGDAGPYALYDRAEHYRSGVAHIIAGAVPGAPTAVDDAYSVAEDGVLTADGVLPNPDGLLANDTGDAFAAVLVASPSAGVLALNGDGTFTYTPNANFNGVDTFHYKANDGLGGPYSNVATAVITVTPVNDGPTAVVDYYNAEEGTTLVVAAPGVLANDVDIDGDVLTATAVGVAPPGTLNLATDGSFDYTPVGLAGAVETFDYDACDPSLVCSTTTVTITVVPPAANVPPFANDDFATATKNSIGNVINLTDNDVDADGTINTASVVITTGTTTQRGGTVINNGDGTVSYTPKKGFRGTDTFQYTVQDNTGATSNVATVHVNVTN